jgi:carboxylesterase type B
LRIASEVTYVLGYYVDKTYGYGDFYYGPIVDGQVIRDYPSREFARGAFTKVPLLTNREGYEGYGFSNQSETNVAEETADLEQLFPYWRLNPGFFEELYSLYPGSDYNSTFYQRETLFGDDFICCPSQRMANYVSDARLPAYKLIFNAGE